MTSIMTQTPKDPSIFINVFFVEEINVTLLVAMLGVLIKIYDDVVDMKLSIGKNDTYMSFLKTWIVMITIGILNECFVVGPFALVIMFCSYLCDRLDDHFWVQYGCIVLLYCLPQMYKFLETSFVNIVLVIMSVTAILYEEIGFPEELSQHKITCRLNGTLLIALASLVMEFSEVNRFLDTDLLTLFMVFGESYSLTSVVNQLLYYT
jgi:hypothetical protein